MNNKILVSILIVNFIIRLFFLFSSDFLVGDDGERYLVEGKNLYEYGVFSNEKSTNPNPTAHDLPAYPFLIYTLLKLSVDIEFIPLALGILNLLFLNLIIYIIYLITKNFTTNKYIPIISIIIFSLNPNIFVYANFHMPDIIFTCLILSTVLYYLRWLKSENKMHIIMVFLFWGISVLLKPISMFFGIIIFTISLLIKSSYKIVILSFLTGCLTLLPWSLRNKQEFNSYSLTSISGNNLFNFNYRFLLEYQNENNLNEKLNEKEVLKNLNDEDLNNPMKVSELLFSHAFSKINKNFKDYFFMSVCRHSKMYLRTSSISFFIMTGDKLSVEKLKIFNSNINFNNFYNLTLISKIYLCLTLLFVTSLYLLTIIGSILLFDKKNFFILLISWFIIFYFIIILGPLNATRYSIPMIPFFSILSSFGFYKLIMNK